MSRSTEYRSEEGSMQSNWTVTTTPTLERIIDIIGLQCQCQLLHFHLRWTETVLVPWHTPLHCSFAQVYICDRRVLTTSFWNTKYTCMSREGVLGSVYSGNKPIGQKIQTVTCHRSGQSAFDSLCAPISSTAASYVWTFCLKLGIKNLSLLCSEIKKWKVLCNRNISLISRAIVVP